MAFNWQQKRFVTHSIPSKVTHCIAVSQRADFYDQLARVISTDVFISLVLAGTPQHGAPITYRPRSPYSIRSHFLTPIINCTKENVRGDVRAWITYETANEILGHHERRKFSIFVLLKHLEASLSQPLPAAVN